MLTTHTQLELVVKEFDLSPLSSMAQQLVSMMQMGGQAAGGDNKEQQMPFKIKEDEVKADLKAPGVKVEKFETKTEGDQQHFYVHISFDKVTSLNNTKTFKEMPISWKEENGTVTFTQVLKAKKKEGAAKAGGDDAMQKQMAQAMFGNAAFKYSVKLPSKALPSPATNGTIADDGKTVNWTFPLVEMDSGDKTMDLLLLPDRIALTTPDKSSELNNRLQESMHLQKTLRSTLEIHLNRNDNVAAFQDNQE